MRAERSRSPRSRSPKSKSPPHSRSPPRDRSPLQKIPTGDEIISQIHEELAQQLQKEFALTTNLDFTNIDLSSILKKDPRSLLYEEGESVDPGIELKDIEEFFHFLNPLSQKIRKEHIKDLLRRISGCSDREAEKKTNLLFGGREEIDSKTLYSMIKATKFVNFDPIEQAYRELSPDENGKLDPAHLKQLIEGLGLGSIENKDLHLLQEVADIDKDGVITLEDFRALAAEMENYQEEEKKDEDD
eukprot:TRINITY_DN560_c0_g4_i1.p1 TRINITY_DN560_c0_g4~~TRINITY_DN560_c0_g4_i1.p1  ORF type:complete len:244 (-),score=80.49 TRINITY_DN560_c0_g4_i1:55-786(-)